MELEEKFSPEYSRRRASYWAKLMMIQPFKVQVWDGDKPSVWIDITSKKKEDQKKLAEMITKPELHRTRFDNELIIDFDNKSRSLNFKRAKQVRDYLIEEWSLDNVRWFSGNKGVHIHSIIENAGREQMLGLFYRINQNFRTKIDRGVMEYKRHMIRGEYSLNSKSGFIKYPIDEAESPAVNILSPSTLEELSFIYTANRVDKPEKKRIGWISWKTKS